MTDRELRDIVACVCGARGCDGCPLYGGCFMPEKEKAISVARKLFFAKDKTLRISLRFYRERDRAIYMSFVKHVMGVKYT